MYPWVSMHPRAMGTSLTSKRESTLYKCAVIKFLTLFYFLLTCTKALL
ncbi:unnamed protein product [Amoebophrya sp. A25]|nr:unnamed protein product [Amoebophrya sp. A25]|eukprot:GSA25T00005191001.1